jgi:hypothetical protein
MLPPIHHAERLHKEVMTQLACVLRSASTVGNWPKGASQHM